MKKLNLSTRFKVFMYGIHILEVMDLDAILEKLNQQAFTQFSVDNDPDDVSHSIQENLDFLLSEAMIKAYDNQSYSITKKGRLKLASGGYVGDAKKDKNALFAFRISITALVLAITSFLVSLFIR